MKSLFRVAAFKGYGQIVYGMKNNYSSIEISKGLAHYLSQKQKRYETLTKTLSEQSLSPNDLALFGKEFSDLSGIIELAEEQRKHLKALEELNEIEDKEVKAKKKSSSDEQTEFLNLIKDEMESEKIALERVEETLIRRLIPADADDNRSVVIDVRAGTGGDEASLFASEIFKMYQKYALLRGWRWEQLSLQKTEVGGFKEAQGSVTGDAVYKTLKFENGVHRVQRIPANDTRIHTSAANVMVLPEAEEVDVELKPGDLRIDVFRSQGAGGQGVNKTESAVRITHLPTGLNVSMQDERSQIQNRAKAMKYLRARLYALEKKKYETSRQEMRSQILSTGERSDKIRTYNFPQDRVKDHRVQKSIIGVERFLNGECLSEVIQELELMEDRAKIHKFLEDMQSQQ